MEIHLFDLIAIWVIMQSIELKPWEGIYVNNKTVSAISLTALGFLFPLSLIARAQDPSMHYEIGIVYYADDGGFKALKKEAVEIGGRGTLEAKIKGAHAEARLRTNQPQLFRVCNVDPSRFKLYKFKSEENARTVAFSTRNAWTGSVKIVLPESEIPVRIQASESGCFTITPEKSLQDGEFGFSPDGANEAFMFGVGDVWQAK